MTQILLVVLLCIPVAAALLLQVKGISAWVARIGSVGVIAASAAFAVSAYGDAPLVIDLSAYHWVGFIALGIDLAVGAYLIYVAVKEKSPLLFLISLAQMAVLLVFEFSGEAEKTAATIYVDKLSLLMILIVGVVGGLIALYSVEYFKVYHKHHREFKDRRRFFFAVMFLFLTAMFGLVIMNELALLLTCWELTSLASFLMIGYTRTPEARRNALTAILMNGFGGLCFTVAVTALSSRGVGDLRTLITGGYSSEAYDVLGIAVFLMSLAALTKSAQLPFSQWLLGAMVAPTPSSALLHSSTMVKAGVYLLVRLAPAFNAEGIPGAGVFGFNSLNGAAVTLIGGATFFITAILAVSQRDAKKLLAYSTISNLGLIVACAGIGTEESLWAAIMLIVFHAIAKALLFLAVGSAEHQIGSRDIESMDGLSGVSKPLTLFLTIGIAGMFIAPFGMLISKWAAMKAFIDSGNLLVVMLIAFGSTITLFFWTKWLGKLLSGARFAPPEDKHKMGADEKLALGTLAAMVAAVCAAYRFVAGAFIEYNSPIGELASNIILLMVMLLFILPIILIPVFSGKSMRGGSVYMAGANAGDDAAFRGSMGKERRVELTNLYMDGWFGEKIWFNRSVWASALLLAAWAFLAAAIR